VDLDAHREGIEQRLELLELGVGDPPGLPVVSVTALTVPSPRRSGQAT
jgi:hypothetical protein